MLRSNEMTERLPYFTRPGGDVTEVAAPRSVVGAVNVWKGFWAVLLQALSAWPA
jgi:hypothetical protein